MAITKPFSSRLSKSRRRSTPPASPRRSNSGGEVSTLPALTRKEGEFRQVFRYLDADNDGKISADELTSYFSAVGDSLSREEAEKIIRNFSRSGEEEGSLLLEFGKFMQVMELRDGGGDEGVGVLRWAFEVYEEEKGSGCITAEGLRKVLRRLGDVKSVEECKAMIRPYDLDGNGVLDFDEFYKMMS